MLSHDTCLKYDFAVTLLAAAVFFEDAIPTLLGIRALLV